MCRQLLWPPSLVSDQIACHKRLPLLSPPSDTTATLNTTCKSLRSSSRRNSHMSVKPPPPD
ncbi:hypothetical protein Hanom_Chr02g00127181 [Helianthus anomalus]